MLQDETRIKSKIVVNFVCISAKTWPDVQTKYQSMISFLSHDYDMSFLWAWTTSISTIDWGRPPSDLGHIVRYVSRASSRNSGRSFVGIGSTHGKIDSSQSKTYNTVITSKKFEEWMKRTSNPWLFIDRLIPRESHGNPHKRSKFMHGYECPEAEICWRDLSGGCHNTSNNYKLSRIGRMRPGGNVTGSKFQNLSRLWVLGFWCQSWPNYLKVKMFVGGRKCQQEKYTDEAYWSCHVPLQWSSSVNV